MTRIHANLILTAAALIWGSAFVAQNLGTAHIGPTLFTGIRFLIGTLVVTPLMVLEWRRRSRSQPPLVARDAWKVAGLGCLLLMGAVMQQLGIMSTSVTNAEVFDRSVCAAGASGGLAAVAPPPARPRGLPRGLAWRGLTCSRAHRAWTSAVETCG